GLFAAVRSAVVQGLYSYLGGSVERLNKPPGLSIPMVGYRPNSKSSIRTMMIYSQKSASTLPITSLQLAGRSVQTSQPTLKVRFEQPDGKLPPGLLPAQIKAQSAQVPPSPHQTEQPLVWMSPSKCPLPTSSW